MKLVSNTATIAIAINPHAKNSIVLHVEVIRTIVLNQVMGARLFCRR